MTTSSTVFLTGVADAKTKRAQELFYQRTLVERQIFPRCRVKNRHQRKQLIRQICLALPEFPASAWRTVTYGGVQYRRIPHFVIRFPQHNLEVTRQFCNTLPKELGALLFSGGCVIYRRSLVPDNCAVSATLAWLFVIPKEHYDDYYRLMQALEYATALTSQDPVPQSKLRKPFLSHMHYCDITSATLLTRPFESYVRIAKLERIPPPMGLDFDGDCLSDLPYDINCNPVV